MRKTLISAIVVSITASAAFAQARTDADNQKAVQEVQKAEDEWRAAVAKGDEAVLKRLIADDILFVNSGGVTSDKSVIAVMTANPLPNLKYDDEKVRVYGEAAIFSARLTTGDNRKMRISRFWVRRQGQWQLVSAQLTEIAS
jgi:ketosteroid isomerase-like protein